MVSVTSNRSTSVFHDGINGTKTVSPNGTYSVNVTIQPSNTIAYTSNQTQVNGLSNASTITVLQNSTKNNSTELVKAYKTEFHGEVSITVFTKTNYTIWVQNTGNLSRNCSFIPGDETQGVLVASNVSSVSLSHRYFTPGRYRARIQCVRNQTVLVEASRRVVVGLPVVHSGLRCPDLFQTDSTYYCVFTVDQASVLDTVLAIGNDLKTMHTFPGKMIVCAIFLVAVHWC